MAEQIVYLAFTLFVSLISLSMNELIIVILKITLF